MSERLRRVRIGGPLLLLCALAAAKTRAADNARQIVEEAQRRTDATSQRYEGVLQVFDPKGKVSDKRWTLERLRAVRCQEPVSRATVGPLE